MDEMGSGLLSSPVILYSESPLQDITQSSPSLGYLEYAAGAQCNYTDRDRLQEARDNS